MRVAYYAPVDVSLESGVCKKILSQVRAWRASGVEVKVFAYSVSWRAWEGFPAHLIEVVDRGGPLNRLQRVNRLVRSILEWKPDLVYMRLGFYYPPLEYLMQKIPTVLEINTNDIAEARLYLSPVKYLYYRVTRRRFFKYAAGLVCVTGELADLCASFGLPIIVIPNGINLRDYAELPPPENTSPVLFFIGHAWEKTKAPLKSASYWYHGIEKIFKIARFFPEWHFFIVGHSLSGPIPRNVQVFGHLSQTHYESLIRHADVAIGSLGLHVQSMSEACPLKVREYLAYGLPVIIGYHDADFPNGAPFVLQLPNTPDNVEKNIDQIKEFVYKWKGRRVPRSEIAHLDVERKEAQRLTFMRNLIRGSAK